MNPKFFTGTTIVCDIQSVFRIAGSTLIRLTSCTVLTTVVTVVALESRNERAICITLTANSICYVLSNMVI